MSYPHPPPGPGGHPTGQGGFPPQQGDYQSQQGVYHQPHQGAPQSLSPGYHPPPPGSQPPPPGSHPPHQGYQQQFGAQPQYYPQQQYHYQSQNPQNPQQYPNQYSQQNSSPYPPGTAPPAHYLNQPQQHQQPQLPGQPPGQFYGSPSPQPGHHFNNQAGYAPPHPATSPGLQYGLHSPGYAPPHPATSPGPSYGLQQPFVQPAFSQQPLGIPSPGYESNPNLAIPGSMTSKAQGILKNLLKLNIKERALIEDLAKLDPYQIASLNRDWNNIPTAARQGMSLSQMIEYKKKGGDFAATCAAIARGPLDADVWLIKKAVEGTGTDEASLDDVLMCRSNADIIAIRNRYHAVFKKTLAEDVGDDLSGNVKSMFAIIIGGNRSEDPVDLNQTSKDAEAIHKSMNSDVISDKMTLCNRIVTKNNAQIAATADMYHRQFGKTLVEFIKDHLCGTLKAALGMNHMGNALVLFVERAINLAKADAARLEDSMAGFGTNETKLLHRVGRVHWNPMHLQAVKREFQTLKGKSLETRIKGETSGDFREILLACVA